VAIIVGDIHGDIAMARAFLAYKPVVEHVALGDFVDSRNPATTFEAELACLDLLLGSKAVLLWGNHDLAYVPERPWKYHTRFGSIASTAFESRYQGARDRFTAAYAVDGWLCTHAGVSTALTAHMAGAPFGCGDPVVVAAWLNIEFERELAIPQRLASDRIQRRGVGPLFCVDWTRGGKDQYGGIFWYDPQWEPSYPPDPRVRQIFAHTQVEGPMKKATWINIHIESGAGYWVYDTEVDDFVVLRA
jgi:hypothetical protein